MEKTCTTKRQYLYDVWRFLEYIKREYNVNINHARDVSYVKPTVIETYLGYIDVKKRNKSEDILFNTELLRLFCKR